MAICARSPEAGTGWRIGFVASGILSGTVVIYAWRKSQLNFRQVLLVALLLRVIAFPLLPSLSDDGFRYVWDGMVQTQQHINPYEYRPNEEELSVLHVEPVYNQLNSASFYSVYPPASQLVFALGGLFYPMGWKASWFAIKLLMVLAEIAGVVLLGRLASSRAVLLYAWHPVSIIEIAGQAHTEALAVFFIVLALYTAKRDRTVNSAIAIVGAGWTKLVPFLVLPAFFRRMTWKAISVGIAFSVLLALPYWQSYTIPHIQESLDLYIRFYEFNAGLYFALKSGALALGVGDTSKFLGPALQWLFLGSVCVVTIAAIFRQWNLQKIFAVVLSLFLILATTVHPWYVLPLLIIAPLLLQKRGERWLGIGWVVFGVFSIGTYFTYIGFERAYWVFVVIAWSALLILLLVGLFEWQLPAVMKRRARSKVNWILAHLPQRPGPANSVLDLGAGDGYVAQRLREEIGAEVMLADVVDYVQTNATVTLYDGNSLPFRDQSFDLTVLSFTLHHSAEPDKVLLEALRTTSKYVVVLESTYKTAFQRAVLESLDRIANMVRSYGGMNDALLSFRTHQEWLHTFEQLPCNLLHTSLKGKWVHRQALYVLKCNYDTSNKASATSSTDA